MTSSKPNPNVEYLEMFEQFRSVPGKLDESLRNSMTLNADLARVVLKATDESVAVASKWTNEAMREVSNAAAASDRPENYSETMKELAASSIEVSARHLSAFSEIARRVQAETLELVLSSGKPVAQEPPSKPKSTK